MVRCGMGVGISAPKRPEILGIWRPGMTVGVRPDRLRSPEMDAAVFQFLSISDFPKSGR